MLIAAHALRTRLRRLPRTADVAEALLRAAGVAFRREAPPEEERSGKKDRKRSHRRKDKKKRRRREADESDDDEADEGSDGSDDGAGGALRAAPATWRCALDGFALPRDAAATAELLADAASDAWLRAAQARADTTRDERR